MDLDLTILNFARGLASHSAARQSVLARNVANADTPGYKALDIPAFSELHGQDPEGWTGLRTTRPGHLAEPGALLSATVRPLSGMGAESPDGNTVSLERQMLASAAAAQSHDLAMSVYRKSLDILRIGIGRAR